ncbi:MAG: TetR/AcrR family transcriptional regulator [Solirubrobacterales bacterium]
MAVRRDDASGAPALSDRERIGETVIDLVLERGYGAVTTADLLQRAEISPETFAREFSSLEDCVLGAVDDGVERFREVVFGAYESHEDWRDGLRTAAYAAARWIRDHPRYVVFATMMMNQATELARAHRDMALQMFVEIVDAGRRELDDPCSVSPETAMTVIGSIYELLQRELTKGQGTARAEDFVPELMYVAVRPYLGHAEALKELSIPPPEDEG